MRVTIGGTLALSLLLSGCDRQSVATSPGPKSPGRFAGIGIFDAGRLWAQMSSPAGKDDAATAKIADDEHIIVVIDSHTGEVRQCGDHSGYCVASNLWAANAPPGALPAKLVKHMADLKAEDREEAEVENSPR